MFIMSSLCTHYLVWYESINGPGARLILSIHASIYIVAAYIITVNCILQNAAMKRYYRYLQIPPCYGKTIEILAHEKVTFKVIPLRYVSLSYDNYIYYIYALNKCAYLSWTMFYYVVFYHNITLQICGLRFIPPQPQQRAP